MKTLLVVLAFLACTSMAQGDKSLKYKPHQPDLKDKVLEIQEIKDNKTPKDVSKKPKFCNDLACPPYKVKESTKDYELREYEATRWVSTALTGVDFKMAQYTMFMKLFKYISGNNDGGRKINMTVPVLVRIIPGQGPACDNNFTMAFYIDADAPNAKDPSVSVVNLPAINAYVKSFPGFANKEKWIDAAESLGKKLTEDEKAYDDSFFYTAGYDAPFKLFKRHNEVWLLAK